MEKINKTETFLKTNKLSVLLSLALDDLESVEKDPNYGIDMGNWHRKEKGQCYVCLAGSLLAKTFKYPKIHIDCLEDEMSSIEITEIAGKLQAIDCIRIGELKSALQHLGHTKEEEAIYEIEYEVNCCTNLQIRAVDIFLGEEWRDFEYFKDCYNFDKFVTFYRRVANKLNEVGL